MTKIKQFTAILFLSAILVSCGGGVSSMDMNDVKSMEGACERDEAKLELLERKLEILTEMDGKVDADVSQSTWDELILIGNKDLQISLMHRDDSYDDDGETDYKKDLDKCPSKEKIDMVLKQIGDVASKRSEKSDAYEKEVD